MIFKARAKYVSTSPQKARLVADLIKGKSVGEAVAILRFTRKKVARTLESLLHDAVANAQSIPSAQQVDVDALKVKNVVVDMASLRTRKRTMPASLGRAFRFVRRQSHITIALEEEKAKRS
ncbi:MAG: 50S ribosomal protein L22 [Acidobacteriota bacterium]|nr:50S ribosomal protein L22 [Thermoanaerobaculaceae bacterium]